VQLAKKLAGLLIKNFGVYEAGVSTEVKVSSGRIVAAPRVITSAAFIDRAGRGKLKPGKLRDAQFWAPDRD